MGCSARGIGTSDTATASSGTMGAGREDPELERSLFVSQWRNSSSTGAGTRIGYQRRSYRTLQGLTEIERSGRNLERRSAIDLQGDFLSILRAAFVDGLPVLHVRWHISVSPIIAFPSACVNIFSPPKQASKQRDSLPGSLLFI